MVLVTMDVI